jgi:membrane protease YdiL (CAAX protease family)
MRRCVPVHMRACAAARRHHMQAAMDEQDDAKMAHQSDTLIGELGLHTRWAFAAERPFYVALAVAPVALLLLTALAPSWSSGMRMQWPTVLSLVLWQPLVEELLFRGVLQGQLYKHAWARLAVCGISVANLATSLLFMLAHLAYHTPAWAIAVLLPSLVFGYFRDRYQQVLPSMLLHAAYNGCYLVAGAVLHTRA